MKAIVYESYTGHTAAYAKLLAERTRLPVYSRKDAKNALRPGDPIVYMGWLNAGSVMGFSQARKRYDVRALCAVGMTERLGEVQVGGIRKKYALDELPVFYLAGGFEMDKLHGVYKLMMRMMERIVAGQLAKKQDKDDADREMLDLIRNGGSLVGAKRLGPVADWWRRTEKRYSARGAVCGTARGFSARFYARCRCSRYTCEVPRIFCFFSLRKKRGFGGGTPNVPVTVR